MTASAPAERLRVSALGQHNSILSANVGELMPCEGPLISAVFAMSQQRLAGQFGR